jgi:hypothetical protein
MDLRRKPKSPCVEKTIRKRLQPRLKVLTHRLSMSSARCVSQFRPCDGRRSALKIVSRNENETLVQANARPARGSAP